MEKIKTFYNKIIKELLSRADRKRVEGHRFYHKKGNYISYGVSNGDFKLITKKYKNQIKGLNKEEAFDLMRMFYKSGIEDQIYVGNFIAALRPDILNPSNLNIFNKSLDYFHTWGTIDDFCVHVLEPVLQKYPKQTLALLRKWNKSKNLWKRRASVVAFTRKAGESGKFTDEALRLCNDLVNDKEDLVQKGVGWALKDVMRGDKQKVLDFVKDLRKRGISSVITLYALRDVGGLERKLILNIKPNE